MDVVGARDHDRAGGLLVEAVHDSRTQRSADGRQSRDSAEAMQQRGDHRAAGHARARMDDHAGRLVDDGDILVFVENVERNGFRLDTRSQFVWELDGNGFTGLDMMRRLARRSVNLYAAFVHQRFNARAAQRGELRDEEHVESLGGVFGGDNEFHLGGGFYATNGPPRRGPGSRAELQRQLHGRAAKGKRR